MNICHSPRTSAPAKPMKASQKCARMRRLLLNTIDSPPGCRKLLETRLLDDPDLRPHSFVAVAAELVAGHLPFAGFREARVDRGNVAGDQHDVDRRLVHEKAVHDVGAGHAEADG